MKKLLLLSIIAISTITTSAQKFNWGKRIGSTSYDGARALAVDLQGNSYTVGYFFGAADFDGGPGNQYVSPVAGKTNAFLLKLDSRGNFVWVKILAGGDLFFKDVETDKDGNVYVIGKFNGTLDADPGSGTTNLTSNGSEDILVVKLSSSGTFKWARNFGTNSADDPYNILTDGAGNIYWNAWTTNSIDFDPGAGTVNPVGPYTHCVAKLDSNGNFIHAFSTPVKGAFTINLDHQANILVSGQFIDSADMNPGSGVYKLYGYYSIGSTLPTSYLSKFDSSGSFLWSKHMGGNSTKASVPDASGNIFVTGFFSERSDLNPGTDSFFVVPTSTNQSDVFITRLDANGNFIWGKIMAATVNESVAAINIKSNGNLVITGQFQAGMTLDPASANHTVNSNTLSQDIFITEFTNSGSYVNVWIIGGKSFQEAPHDIDVDPSNNIIVVGSLIDSADLDPGPGVYPTGPGGPEDIFIVKLGQCSSLKGQNPVSVNGVKGTNAQFTVTVLSEAAKVRWQADTAGTFVDLADGADYSGTQTGTLTVKNLRLAQDQYKYRVVISEGACSDTSSAATLSVTNTSLKEYTEPGLRIYPNPAHNYIRIETLTPGTFYLYDINCKILKEFRVEKSEVLNISELPAGVYFLTSEQSPGSHYKLLKY